MTASARTRSLGVIGWPVGHSLSPAMQEAGFAALGLDWRYGAFAVPPAGLAAAVAGAGALGFVGLNVTVPHKEAVLRHCAPDETAARLGAVNTLVYGPDPLAPPRGHNTDLHGFRMLLVEAGVDARGRRAIVLGAGGAARAAVWALLEEGAEVTVVTRSARTLRFDDGPLVEHVPWDGALLARLLGGADLLVDATGRGLDPAAAPLDLGPLPPHAAVVDLVVRETPLITTARARGLRAAAGEAMLLHQGAAALALWSGRAAPVEVMRAALAAALAAK